MKRLFLFLSLCAFLQISCTKEKSSTENLSKEKELLTFGFVKADNPGINNGVTGNIDGQNITITVPVSSNVTALKAYFSSSSKSSVKVGSVIQESNKTINNFSNPVIYSIIAEDGSSTNYTVTVIKSNDLVEPIIKNQWVTFKFPYNAYYPYNPSSSNIINGREGNACGPTALAKVLHSLQYPANGIGNIDFTDSWGLHWICDLATLNLNYSNMPLYLSPNDPEATYKDVAKLFLAAGAASFYLKIWAGTVDNGLVPGIVQYFNLDPGLHLVNRWQVTREEWINILKTEFLAGRPVMIAGRTPDSPAPGLPGSVSGHWFNVDGFNAQGLFHVSYNYGGIDGYFDADNLGGVYTSYNQAIVGFKAKQ